MKRTDSKMAMLTEQLSVEMMEWIKMKIETRKRLYNFAKSEEPYLHSTFLLYKCKEVTAFPDQSHKQFNKSICKSWGCFYQFTIHKVQAIQSCDGKSNLKYEQPSNNICSVSHSADNKPSKSDSLVWMFPIRNIY